MKRVIFPGASRAVTVLVLGSTSGLIADDLRLCTFQELCGLLSGMGPQQVAPHTGFSLQMETLMHSSHSIFKTRTQECSDSHGPLARRASRATSVAIDSSNDCETHLSACSDDLTQ